MVIFGKQTSQVQSSETVSLVWSEGFKRVSSTLHMKEQSSHIPPIVLDLFVSGISSSTMERNRLSPEEFTALEWAFNI